MKYKGTNKIYFGIGTEETPAQLNAIDIFFYWFKLKQRNPEGEDLMRGRDYTGFIFRKTIRTVFNFKINL